MRTKAAISKGDGKFFIDDIEVHDPGPDEVLVKLRAAGICHTDWDSLSWEETNILGHEGAGEVLSTGSNVTHVSKDDKVLLNWAIPCGDCFQCKEGNTCICEKHSISAEGKQGQTDKTYWKGNIINRSFSLGTMSGYTVVRKEAVTKIGVNISFASAAIVGCGVMTGFGSAINAADVKPGSSVVVLGCGGVGLNVIQGAKVAGASKIIAVDLKAQRLNMAEQFGATHTIKSTIKDKDLSIVKQQVFELTDNRGADYAFESTGNPALGAAPLLLARHAGKAIQVSGIEQELTIDMNLFEWDKLYLNPLYGQCNPERDFPRIFDLYDQGKLLLDELVTRTYSLDQLGQAFEDMLSGKNAKGVILMGE